MTWWRTIGEILAHWTDTVATGVIALASRFFSPRVVRLVEDTPDTFALEGTGKAGAAQRVTFANGRFGGADLAGAPEGRRKGGGGGRAIAGRRGPGAERCSAAARRSPPAPARS